MLERLTENSERLPAAERNLLFPLVVTVMLATRGRKALELAPQLLRRHADLMTRRVRLDCEGLLEAAAETPFGPPETPDRPRWTVYEICAGNVEWPALEDDEEGLFDGEAESGEMNRPTPSTPMRLAPVPGRNDPCWCGSGKKYKKCHLDSDVQAQHARHA